MLSRIKSFFEVRLGFMDSLEESADNEHTLQLATTALLLEVSRADHNISEAEIEVVVKEVQKAYSLSSEETEQLVGLATNTVEQSISLSEFTRLLNDNLSRDEKIHVIELLWRVANADSHIDKFEDYVVRKIADLLHVSHRDFIRMKHKALENN